LEFPRGSVSALVGPSGAGKTTLADLLLGLIAPTSGTVLIDARALDASLRARWRRSTAYAPQEPYLFAGTLRENLLWACPGASDHELEDALRDAGAKHLIDSGAGGLDREVGERGSALSGGERQRVAIARALLRAPSFLVLDEPTSALDSESEREVVRTIAELRGKVTIVIVAHRPGIVCAAERIVELVGGRVVRVEEREALAGSRET
ncbi:MAG TPA: ATP-binding cassette domain-containing protein, partial [Planctomycetota bacterium]|nr:ATP-binding cassette domain-containing protein [Planctomycetota bacterium]